MLRAATSASPPAAALQAFLVGLYAAGCRLRCGTSEFKLVGGPVIPALRDPACTHTVRVIKKQKQVAEVPPPVRSPDANRSGLFVVLRRMLVLLEAFDIVGHEHLALFRIPDPLDVGIPVNHLGRIIGQPDARQDILRPGSPACSRHRWSGSRCRTWADGRPPSGFRGCDRPSDE